jgi:hypothetical protein
MSESEQQANASQIISTVRIAQPIPVLFADGVTSQSYGPGIAKFYFSRIDPDPLVSGPTKVEQILQIVMPAEAFVTMTAFFEQRLKMMVASKIISQESVDNARQFWVEHPTGGQVGGAS